MTDAHTDLAVLPRRQAEDRPRTRLQLLEAAGHVFAEKGFDRATGKEICRRVGANTAAINYYFGGMEGLYAAVLDEANSRLVPLSTLASTVAGKTDAKAKLGAIIELVIDRLTGPVSASWVLGVIGREFLAPSPALERLRKEQAIPKAHIITSIVAELMGLPREHAAVARACLTLFAPFALLMIADRPMLAQVFPSLDLSPASAGALARHMLNFALAGLAAVARDAHESR
jgi:TetR/AcrR family transcriptional regulator, regulator of cefoperazone and chloramphenicol sensitivity